MTELPQPSAGQLQIHEALLAGIVAEIDTSAGMDFCRYMHRCLYEPGLGYYQNPYQKLGEAGDFTTAAEISSDYASCLATQISRLPAPVSGASILEFGGGTGQLACDLLLALQRLGVEPANYLLLDVSGDLRSSQKAAVDSQLPVKLRDKVLWPDELPTGLTGVVIANELFDAFPVERFRIERGEALREYVVLQDGQLQREFRAHCEVADRVDQLQAYTGERLAEGYESEFCPLLAPWWASLGDVLHTGVVLASDYGQERSEYYSLKRDGGSVRCFYRHRVHDNPWIYAGIQDITADVDFTAVTEAATAAGFELQGYTPLSQFMLALGVLESFGALQQQRDKLGQLAASGQLKRLLLPEEMGDRFKVIGFSKGLDGTLDGFTFADYTRLL